LEGCPASAITKDPATGAVVVDPKHCMGCKYCTWACPYDAPRYAPGKGIVEKCDFCVERLTAGEAPACVCACPTNALRHGDYDPAEEPEPPQTGKVEGFTDAKIDPGIRFKALRKQQRAPKAATPAAPETVEKLYRSALQLPERKISLKKEWTLLVFTSIAFILVAFLTAAVATGMYMSGGFLLGAGLIGMALSTVHLGKKTRAYRAVFNIKTSWLAREILLFSLFLFLGWLYLSHFPGESVLGWVAVVIGFAGLFAIDRLYQVAMHISPMNFHSAQTLFNGLYLAGILTGNLWIFGGAGLVKLSLYVYRKKLLSDMGRPISPWLSAGRVAMGFLIPVMLFAIQWTFTTEHLTFFSSFCVLIGELMDRTEFYNELDIITPEKQLLTDLKLALDEV
jgi:DMSO reductase anchor subunit/NAD-dependent dihydropyrimidine dehydrogenase PreA subunit